MARKSVAFFVFFLCETTKCVLEITQSIGFSQSKSKLKQIYSSINVTFR